MSEVNVHETLPSVVVTTGVICSTCKNHTGITKDTIMDTFIDRDIVCPHCGSMLYSARPIKGSSYSSYSHEYHRGGGGQYDTDAYAYD
jgi:DNA-directed RNA polymerase subunit RPC12/RpoP